MPIRPLEIQISNWEDYVRYSSAADIGSPIRPTFIFRGQADASWGLLPTLARIAIKEKLGPRKTIEIESLARTKFRELAHLHLTASNIPGEHDLIAWWILMQHYGVPTRVLDWTESPFVALYFAVQGPLEQPGVVWVLHAASLGHFSLHADKEYKVPQTTEEAALFLDPNAKPFLYVLTRHTHTDRMSAQQIQTTISPRPLMDHGTIIGDVLPDRPEVEQFSKLIIPATLKFEFMRRLRKMNVTAGALLPGIEGLGRSMSELIKLTCQYEGPE